MRFKKVDLIIYIIIMFFVGFLGAYAGLKIIEPRLIAKHEIETDDISESKYELDDRLQNVIKTYDIISQHFIEEVEDSVLLEGAIEGMLATLDDPYSNYLNAEANEQFQEQIEASFQGIGAEVSMVNGKVTIVSPIRNSPAEKSGLRPNDIILAVDDEKVDGYNLNEVVAKIRGEKGSEVVLSVQRGSSAEPFDLSLVRDEIPIETVHYKLEEVEGKPTGIIEIISFSQRTAEEFIEALDELEDEGIEGLVLDVRGNPGGMLDSVAKILSEFVPKDIPYVQKEDRNGHKTGEYSTLNEKKPYPINVIIDEGSASASEVLAVALLDIGYDVVGTTSFGKGTVQQAIALDNGGLIKLTFFKWLSPKGTWVDSEGITPTIKQALPDFFYLGPVNIEEPLVIDQLGENIKTIQVMLSGLDYDLARTDGYFDESLEKAVKEIQKANDLQVDGIIDEATYAAIEGAVIEVIRSGEQDLQLEKALEALYK